MDLLTRSPAYHAAHGSAFHGDSLDLLSELPDESLNLVITSPPFALQRKKDYGNPDQSEYVDWLAAFAELIYRKLRADGSFVLDLGGAYEKGVPVRSLYNFRVLLCFCDDIGFRLAEDFYWFNPSKLPSPIEWVNKRKIRAKDSVNTVWWFSKTAWPKADITRVLTPYSARMQKLLEDPDSFYSPKKRPSGHDIGKGFAANNGGALPSNLLSIPNSDSNSPYLGICKSLGIKAHPARFPARLPEFFIKYLTDPNDVVLDIFAGSNTTGMVAERLRRRWLAFDSDLSYVAASAFRFASNQRTPEMRDLYERILAGTSVDLEEYGLQQPLELPLGG